MKRRTQETPITTDSENVKKLPVSYLGTSYHELLCLELLAVIYAESSILPIMIDVASSESEDYLSRKYLDQVIPLVLQTRSEIVFPMMKMYDSEMFILNYQKFYDLA